jgi:hypothetical protein
MIYIFMAILHLFGRGHFESMDGLNPGVCCICGKDLTKDKDEPEKP